MIAPAVVAQVMGPGSSHEPKPEKPSIVQYGAEAKDGKVAPTLVTHGEEPTTSGMKVQLAVTELIPLSPLAMIIVTPRKASFISS
mmetsp:Transcript_128668/g.358236  ORF Transcript_128668/g.358236 Transcript_128668/m.358236 type:complete len:85 (-) Transcript_128668:71-325(-)